MTLRTLFAIPIAVILLVVLSLAGVLLGQGLTGLDQGAEAILAVERMRQLVMLQSELWSERVVTNAALGQIFPLPADVAAGLARQRARSDEHIQTSALARSNGGHRAERPPQPEPYLSELKARLHAVRGSIDDLLGRDRPGRTYQEESTIIPRMLEVSATLEMPLARASLDVIAADQGLSGLLTAARLAALMRDRYSAIAGVLAPRFTTDQTLTAADLEAVHVLWAQIVQLSRLLADTIDFASPPDSVRATLAMVRRVETLETRARLERLLVGGQTDAHGTAEISLTQTFLLPMSQAANRLRIAIVDAALARVQEKQNARRDELTVVAIATGVVVFALAAALALLRWRVVRPLALLGAAITRIAAGDRRDPVSLPSEAREIAAMAVSVETLRQAALIADASAIRQRLAEQHRLRLLREALAIVQTVREPAHALENGLEGLRQGIDEAIALMAPANPPTLTAAANAVRLGLAEVRGAADDLETMIATAHKTPPDAWPEADIIAHILAVRAHVERRDAAVRALIPPNLVALRDTVGPAARERGRDDLVAEQFRRIEAAVATMASMREAVARAGGILRDLPLENEAAAA